MNSTTTSAAPFEEQFRQLLVVLNDSHILSYMSVVSVTVLIYDIIITADEETLLVWNSRRSIGKLIYYFIRYGPVVEGIIWLIFTINKSASESFCFFEFVVNMWAIVLFSILLQTIVILRTMAIWNKNRFITLTLVFSAILTNLVAVIISIICIKEIVSSKTTPPLQVKPLIGCIAYSTAINPHLGLPAWSTVIFFDTVLFSITLIKTWKAWKLAPCSQLFAVLLRDGFILYAIMLTLNVLNLVFNALPPSRAVLAGALNPIVKANYSITGSRLILNLRNASRSQFLGPSSETKIETSLRFVDSRLGSVS